MVNKYAKGSWEVPRKGKPHSPEGIAEMKGALRRSLIRYYTGVAESMYRWEFPDPEFEDMQRMSRHTVPEKYLFLNGQCVFFKLNGQIHCLPFSQYEHQNLYGYESKVRPVPTNYVPGGSNPVAYDAIYNMILDDDNSVIVRNDLFGQGDLEIIDAMVEQLVSNTATLSTLQLLAKKPYLLRSNQDNLLSMKNLFTAIAEDAAVVYVDEDTMPSAENIVIPIQVTIDPALMDLFSHFDMLIKMHLGLDCTDIHKRAQISVDEVNMNTDGGIAIRRQERFNQRKMAADRLNELFGTHVTVTCIVEDREDNAEREGDDEDEGLDA